MELKNYIKKEIKKGRRNFNIGVEPNMEVNDKSPNRIKFQVIKNGK